MNIKVKTFILDILIIIICLVIVGNAITLFTGIEEGFTNSLISIGTVIIFRPKVEVITDPLSKDQFVLFTFPPAGYSKRLNIFKDFI